MVKPVVKVAMSEAFWLIATKALIAAATMLNATLVQYISTSGFTGFNPRRLYFELTLKSCLVMHFGIAC